MSNVRIICIMMMLLFGFSAGEVNAQENKLPPDPVNVRVGFFSTSLPLMAAQSKGYFTTENITISTIQVRSSTQMFQLMRDDLMDVAFTSPDNPVNYATNPNNSVGQQVGVKMIFGADKGMDLSLMSRQSFTTAESLRGAKIGVDAPDSGYAYVLYKILASHGLRRGIDYSVIVVGGTPIRLNALIAGTIDATLLNADSYVRARNVGINILGTVTDIAYPYLGSVAAANTNWLNAHSDIAVRFIRAYISAQAWATNPANREEAIQMLMTLPNTTRSLAEQIYALNQGPTGLIAEAVLDNAGLLNVIKLRDEFGGFEKPQKAVKLSTPAGGLLDLRYYRQATINPTSDEDVTPSY